MSITRKIINIVVAPLVLLIAAFAAKGMLNLKKPQPVKSPEAIIAKVAVFESALQDIRPEIHTYGNTQSYLSTSVASQVSGEILKISPAFEAGNSVSEGDWLVEINPADYSATLSSRRSSLAIAKQTLAEEVMRSKLAAEDWMTSGRELSEASDFTLRKPQLEAAKASVEAAEAAVAQAALDLERTKIRAPFDAIVKTRTASPGNIVTPGVELGTLLARSRLEVRLPLTPNQASRISIPRVGSDAEVLQAELTTPTIEDASWVAEINRTDPVVDSKNQTVYLIGEIKNPFENPNAFLPVGAFVEATIYGNVLADVHVMPEVAVVEDAFVWVVSPDNTLAKQPVRIVYSQAGNILTRLDDPIFAMPLKVARRPLVSFREGQAVVPVTEEVER